MKIYGTSPLSQNASVGEPRKAVQSPGHLSFASLSAKQDVLDISNPAKSQKTKPDMSASQPQGLKFSGYNALHKAASADDLKRMHELLRSMSSDFLNEQDKNGNTPLHLAAKKGNINAVRVLLGRPGIDANQKNYDKLSALDLARIEGNYTVARMLKARQGVPVEKLRIQLRYGLYH